MFVIAIQSIAILATLFALAINWKLNIKFGIQAACIRLGFFIAAFGEEIRSAVSGQGLFTDTTPRVATFVGPAVTMIILAAVGRQYSKLPVSRERLGKAVIFCWLPLVVADGIFVVLSLLIGVLGANF